MKNLLRRGPRTHRISKQAAAALEELHQRRQAIEVEMAMLFRGVCAEVGVDPTTIADVDTTRRVLIEKSE